MTSFPRGRTCHGESQHDTHSNYFSYCLWIPVCFCHCCRHDLPAGSAEVPPATPGHTATALAASAQVNACACTFVLLCFQTLSGQCFHDTPRLTVCLNQRCHGAKEFRCGSDDGSELGEIPLLSTFTHLAVFSPCPSLQGLCRQWRRAPTPSRP